MSLFGLFSSEKAKTNRIIMRGYDESGTPVDREIAGYLKLINTNPNVATQGSCFGHGSDTPFITLLFRDTSTIVRYVPKLKAVGFIVANDWPPNGWSVTLPGEKQHRAYSKNESHLFFRKLAAILTDRPVSDIPKGPDFNYSSSKIIDEGKFESGPYEGVEWKLGFQKEGRHGPTWRFACHKIGTKPWMVGEGKTREEATAWGLKFLKANT